MPIVHFTYMLRGKHPLKIRADVELEVPRGICGHPEDREEGNSALVHDIRATLHGEEFDLETLDLEPTVELDQMAIEEAKKQ